MLSSVKMERLKDENIELCRFFIVINKFLNSFKKQRAESEENLISSTILRKLRLMQKNGFLIKSTVYLANLDGATDRVTNQSSERNGFYCDHEETDTKMLAHIKFLCDNIRLNRVTNVSPDSGVVVIS